MLQKFELHDSNNRSVIIYSRYCSSSFVQKNKPTTPKIPIQKEQPPENSKVESASSAIHDRYLQLDYISFFDFLGKLADQYFASCTKDVSCHSFINDFHDYVNLIIKKFLLIINRKRPPDIS